MFENAHHHLGVFFAGEFFEDSFAHLQAQPAARGGFIYGALQFGANVGVFGENELFGHDAAFEAFDYRAQSFGHEHAAPVLPGAMFVADLQPYIERKLFTVNTGHAALAYLGYLDGCRFIHEAMARPEIRAVATGALHESGAGLTFRHRFNRREHEDYIKKILARFANALLPDEVVRVARSPLRKLGAAERLVAPARYALAAGVQPDSLARVIAATLRFDFAGDPEAVSLQAWLRDNGPAATLTRCTGLGSDDPLHRLVIAHTPVVPSA